MASVEELEKRIAALEHQIGSGPVEYYTSRYSGEEMDERLDAAGLLGGSAQQALANLGAGVRPGLGINLGFRINQRGQSRYTANGYTVDGWKAALTNLTSGSVEFKDPGVTITASGDSNGYLDIMQYLEEPLFGRTLTFSVLYEDGTFLTITGTAPSKAPSSNTTFANEMYDKGGIWLRMSSSGKVYMQIRTQAGCSTSPVYAKPEEGPDQTLAYQDEGGGWHLLPQPDADYGMQLMRCQRYFYQKHYLQYQTINLAYEDAAYAFVMIPLPVEMRKNPTMTQSAPILLGSAERVLNTVEVSGCLAKISLNYSALTKPKGAVYAYCNGQEGVTFTFSAEL